MVTTVAVYRTSIAKKAVVAVTGIVFYLFVFAHMLGNLKAFTGAEHLNEYAVFLREVGAPMFPHESLLWMMRLGLIVSLVLHVWLTIDLTRQGMASRPSGYSVKRHLASTLSSRTMRYGGVVIFLFIILHLLHFTTGTLHPAFKGHAQVYSNLIVFFQQPVAQVIYLVAMAALGLHLYHGVWSAAQTLGLRHVISDRFWRTLALVTSVGIAGGFALVPLSILVGVLR